MILIHTRLAPQRLSQLQQMDLNCLLSNIIQTIEGQAPSPLPITGRPARRRHYSRNPLTKRRVRDIYEEPLPPYWEVLL